MGSTVISETRGGQVKLVLNYNDTTGRTTNFEVQALPGDPGRAIMRVLLPPTVNTRRTVFVLRTGTTLFDTFVIPVARRWDVGLQLFPVDNNGDGINDGEALFPTIDPPAGYEFGLEWQPSLFERIRRGLFGG